jgi:hypothetical protein
MGARFAADEKAKRRPLDEAYATAMREVWRAHLGDADIAAWFADAMMMLRPWDLWKKNGEAHPGTDEVLAALDAALRLDARHPLANHLAVHAHEASAQPGRADAAADGLRDLEPGLVTWSTCRRTSTCAAAVGRRRSRSTPSPSRRTGAIGKSWTVR